MVFEPLDAQTLGKQRNLHVVINRPGAVRGNHLHQEATEYISVGGPARVCYRQADRIATIMVAADRVIRFCFPPGVAHAIQNTGDDDQLLVAFSDRPHDPKTPDTVSHPLITGDSGGRP
jgi:oxalate decarboxylase/phosphoglucose isomerase-like protein (cupin superfamily)